MATVNTAPTNAVGAEYADLLEKMVGEQDVRKASIEQRGVSVITTSGALVTLLFGLVALLTKRDGYTLPPESHGWLAGALIAFVTASVLALGANLPLWYLGISPAAVEEMLERWEEPATDARMRVAATRLKLLRRSRSVNSVKGYLLLASMLAEVAAVLCLAFAVGRVLSHA